MRDLIVALSATDRTQAIFAGKVVLRGFRLVPVEYPVEEIFARQATYPVFDVAEFSLGSYLLLRGKGDDRYVALPVFLSRSFRHGSLYVRRESPITRLADLAGVRIGFPEFQMTAAVWVRGLIRDEAGRDKENTWVTYRPERVPVAVPVVRGKADDVLQGLLEGEVDVAMSVRRPPPEFLSRDGSAGRIRRLLPDPWGEERRYYERTGIFPIMHLVVVRRELVEHHPELPQLLYEAFLSAKIEGQRRLAETVVLQAMLPWLTEAVEAHHRTFGDDPWPYGVRRNWATVERFQQYLKEDGLLREVLPPEAVFAASTLDT